MYSIMTAVHVQGRQGGGGGPNAVDAAHATQFVKCRFCYKKKITKAYCC